MGLTVNQKGVIGLVKVTADLVVRQYEVFIPTSDASPVDMVVADNAMVLRRLQVKYREPVSVKGSRSDTRVLMVDLDSIVNGRRVPVDTTKIDGWGIYCPQSEKIYYIRTDEVTGRSIRLCLNDFKDRKARLADDFLEPARLWCTGK